MNIRAEFEQEKDGRWIATIPGLRGVVGYGWSRHEAAIGVTVRALNVLAERIQSGQLEVEDKADLIVLDYLSSSFSEIMGGFGHTPNAETIAAIEELESGGGKGFNSIEELMAELDADD